MLFDKYYFNLEEFKIVIIWNIFEVFGVAVAYQEYKKPMKLK